MKNKYKIIASIIGIIIFGVYTVSAYDIQRYWFMHDLSDPNDPDVYNALFLADDAGSVLVTDATSTQRVQWTHDIPNIYNSTTSQATTTNLFVASTGNATSTRISGGLDVNVVNATSTVATSTFANGIQVPSTHCFKVQGEGCTIVNQYPGFPGLTGFRVTSVQSSSFTANVMQTIYTCPTGKRCMTYSFSAHSGGGFAPNIGVYLLTASNVPYLLEATSTLGDVGSRTVSDANAPGIILEPGEKIGLIGTITNSNYRANINVREFDARVPVFSVKTLDAAIGTTTLYTVPTNKTAEIIGDAFMYLSDPAGSTQNLYSYMNNSPSGTAVTVFFHKVQSGQSADSTNELKRFSNSVSAGTKLGLTGFNINTLSGGDSVVYWVSASTGKQIAWINVAEY